MADAITNSMFFVQSILTGRGVTSEIFAERIDPRLAGAVRPLNQLAVGADDLLLIHHSTGHDALPYLAKLDCRKALVYHNITPPRFFAEDDPSYHYIIKGYAQLGELRDQVEATIAISQFNARQLRQRGFDNVAVIPLLKDFAALRSAPHAKKPYYDARPVFRILHVGRLVPHKCQHELIEFVGATRSIDGVPLELVLVGDAELDPDYVGRLKGRACRLGLEPQVKIMGRVGDEQLFGWYRAATAYVSLSEHEGFGVPLIEAMAFDLPVLAYPSSGVPETLSEAGMTIADKEPATIREALSRLHRDRALRRDLIRRQRQRLRRFERKRIENELALWLAGLGIGCGATTVPADAPRCAGAAQPRTHYVIEGPFETSYSLARVNRNIALALSARAECAAYLEPAEGEEDYRVDTAAAQRLPRAFRDLVRPPPPSAERIVTIRNMFPSRPNGMLGDLRLVHLAWEESAIPPELAAMMNFHLDGVLVPSEYCKRVVRSSGVRLPIAVIGHGIDHSGAVPSPASGPALRSEPSFAAPFTFLHISAGVARKGIEELITAYCIAFSNRDPVVLVIKTFDNWENLVAGWVKRLTDGAEAAPVIQIITDELHAQEIEFLYRRADAVVLPARGEGFNLPAAEAMARGLPVIATRHSGHMDFCNDGNSVLIDFRYERSTSHLQVPHSVWARASPQHLAAAMRTVYDEARRAGTATRARAWRACQDMRPFRWNAVAERIEAFTNSIADRPVMTRKLRLAWISPYNSRCGIAEYSQHLIEHFDADAFDITILAADQSPLGPDPRNVHRIWRPLDVDLAGLRHRLLTGGFDAAFFQHNFDLFDSDGFAAVLQSVQQAGIDTYLTLHRTMDARPPGAEPSGLQRIAAALKGSTRIFVHGVADMNRLKECGVTDNLVLLPHGVIDRPPLSASAVRALLGLERCGPVIGSFGFLLPYKGLQTLIHGFALLLRRHLSAFLLLVNADHPDATSQAEHERCRILIAELGLAPQVRLVGEFLDTDEILFLLSACDAIVFPHWESSNAACGAVSFALAAGRPVAVTPLPLFSDLSDVVHRLPGTTAVDIAEGLNALLADENARSELLRRQRQWVAANSWSTQAGRIANLIRGCFEERHGVELRAPARPTPEARGSAAPRSRISKADGNLLHAAELTAAEALLRRRPPAAESSGPDAEISPEGPTMLPDFRRPLFDGIASRLPDPVRQRARKRTVRHANRARDARDWTLAALYYRRALERDPDRAAIWVQYGHALKETGNFSVAEIAYRRAIALAPAVADTYLQLGHVLKIQGYVGGAVAAYLQALKVDRQFAPALAELAALGWSAGRIERALSRSRTDDPSL
ncbi:MAG TPA: glycosyltransferase [Stellaceae bacterium]|nr:glycosyltransferase [Stellaceae bacterium]